MNLKFIALIVPLIYSHSTRAQQIGWFRQALTDAQDGPTNIPTQDVSATAESRPSLLDGLSSLRQQFGFGGDGDGVLASLLPGRFRPFALGQNTDATTNVSGPPVDECGRLKDRVFEQIQLAVQMSMAYSVQQGFIDFGFMGDANETEACAGQNCAFTNPSSPYGLTILPLSTDEKASDKLNKYSMPPFARTDILQRNGIPHTEPSLRDRFTAFRDGQGTPTPQPVDASKLDAIQQRGMSSAWQLQPQEVVMVAGCLPPKDASRYFAFSHYVHDAWDDNLESWAPVFGSMGDSIGAYVRPGVPGKIPDQGIRNRINSTLPGYMTSPPQADQQAGQHQSQQQQSAADENTLGNDGTILGVLRARMNATVTSQRFGLRSWLRTLYQSYTGNADQGSRSTVDLVRSDITAESAASSGKAIWAGLSDQPLIQAMSGPADVSDDASMQNDTISSAYHTRTADSHAGDDAYGKFAVILMTADSETARKLRSVLDPLLKRLDLEGAVNVLPIAPPFSDDVGLNEHSPYYMLLARNILGSEAGELDRFRQYLQSQPWKAWRLTPKINPALAWGLLAPLLSSSTTQPSFNASTQGFPPAVVIPRVATGDQQTELWFRPPMEWLWKQVDARLTAAGQALSWSIGSDSGLGGAGIDWGIDCYTRKIDFCYGDNRDAQYITNMPMVSLDSMSKVLYVVGVNHAATGMASYVNLAPSDPIQKLGLLSWDDQEMRGSATSWMAGGPYERLSGLFYVVAYARNCTGIPYCKEVPLTGPRSLPLARQLLVLLRAYVNPVTGVGPSAAQMVNFKTVVAVPKDQARPRDYKALNIHEPLPEDDPCKISLVSTAVSCPASLMTASSTGSTADGDVSSSPSSGSASEQQGGDGGGVLRQAAAAAGIGVNRPVFSAISRVREKLPQTDCCKSAQSWAENKCWCSATGQFLLDATSPLPARAMLASVGRTCGLPIREVLSRCT